MCKKAYVYSSKGGDSDQNGEWRLEENKIWWIQKNHLATNLVRDQSSLEQEALNVY